MPPSLRICVLPLEICESYHRVSETLRAEWGALQTAILNVDMVVKLWVVFTADHGENKHVPLVHIWISHLEPELDRVLA